MTAFREARIDTTAITDNVRHLRAQLGTEIIAVVKADAYGHGALRSARAALRGGAQRLGVADIDEALALRHDGIDAPLMAWLHGPDAHFAEAITAGVEIGVSSVVQLRAVVAVGNAVVHLKLETGLGRNGAAPAEYAQLFAEAAEAERAGTIRVQSLFSHLSNTTPADDAAAVARFQDAVALAARAGLTPPQRHIAASHAAIDLPASRLDVVRLGISIYGLSPFADRPSADLGLRPAMSLRAPVAAVRRVPAGQGVSYGYLHRTKEETTLALIPLGYADGIPRSASSSGAVRIGDHTFPVAGRIAMDQFVVDVGNHPVSVGEEAVLFGDPAVGEPPVEAWAAAADTINYEIVTRIGPRVQRVEVGR